MNRFDKYLPCTLLQPYVKYFAVSESSTPTVYKVLPDTSLVAGFQYNGYLLRGTDKKDYTLSTAGITGLQRQFQLFKSQGDIGTVLVYFTATGAFHFLRHPLHELFGENVSLDCLFKASDIIVVQEQLLAARTELQRIQVVEQFLLSHLQSLQPDALVANAVEYIYRSEGAIRIKQLANWLYTSQSPLEKRFRKVVGTSPKVFASIIRFQTLIRKYSSAESLTRQACDAGYYDQAHFIKDFRSFTGQTPEQFFLHR